MAGPLQLGPGTAHIKASHGPDRITHKFYISEYSNRFGHDGYIPRTGKHKGTGYQSNFRPGVYYNRKIDEVDNPKMGKLLTDNYLSMTKVHFKPTKGSNGKDPFPKQVYMVKSGFVRDTTPTIPSTNKVRSVFVDTKYQGTVYPNYKPRLYDFEGKDPVAKENSGHGPNFMSTENKTRFKGLPSEKVDISTKSVGPKEGTGFTHAYNDEPVTFRPNEAHTGQFPGWYTWRPTGMSLMKTDFLPSYGASGTEPFTTVAVGSNREDGYTREIKPKGEFVQSQEQAYTKLSQVPPLVAQRMKKREPAEYNNLLYAKQHPSMTSAAFKGLQREEQTLTEKLGNVSLGTKEETGFTENNCKFVQSAETPFTLQRFNTEYYKRYYDKNPYGGDRMGHTKGNVMKQPQDGFTKSTAVHSFGPEINTTEQLRKLEPYVSRSIKARDVYYDSHVHDSKLKPLTA